MLNELMLTPPTEARKFTIVQGNKERNAAQEDATEKINRFLGLSKV